MEVAGIVWRVPQSLRPSLNAYKLAELPMPMCTIATSRPDLAAYNMLHFLLVLLSQQWQPELNNELSLGGNLV